LLVILTAAIVGMIGGLQTLYDLSLSRESRRRIAALEFRLHEAEQRAAAVSGGSAADIEGMREALAAIEHVFRIPGVVEAARRAARKALHPDGHPEAGADEIAELTKRFQSAEAVFDRFSH